jgi:hypothetical protein
VPLRSLILDTLAREPHAGDVAARWEALRIQPRAFARLLALEDCASDLLVRLDALAVTDHVPGPLLDVVQRRARRERAHMLSMRVQLLALLHAFRARGITVTLLKGAAFLHTGIRPYRACMDIDIAPAAKDLEAAADVLRALGYAARPETGLPGDHHHLPPFDREGAVPVELHTRLLGDPGAPAPDDVATREIAPGVRVLTPTEWCWHAIAHDAQHPISFGRTQTALDVGALVDAYGAAIDWSTIAARATRSPHRIEPQIASALRLGYRLPLAVSGRTHAVTTGLGVARDALAHVGPDGVLFGWGTRKLGVAGSVLLGPGLQLVPM